MNKKYNLIIVGFYRQIICFVIVETKLCFFNLISFLVKEVLNLRNSKRIKSDFFK